MRHLLILFLFTGNFCFSQEISERRMLQKLLDSLSIPLNKPMPPHNYTMTYGCDSIPFFKKVCGDTITLLTPAGMTPMTYNSGDSYNSFLDWLPSRNSYPPTFPTEFSSDGRLNIVTYKELIFLYRNDSLFERELNRDKFENDLAKLLDKLTAGKIDQESFEKSADELTKNEKSFYKNKLIFSKTMFSKDSIYKIPKHLNYRNPTVILLRKWNCQKSLCYTILIKERFKDFNTEVAFSFNDQMKFILWEGCEK